MTKNNILEEVRKIEDIELDLTVFNSKRALANVDKDVEVKTIGNCKLIYDKSGSESIYYNRVKGFSLVDVDKLDKILEFYNQKNLVPCFDMTPNNINEDVAVALSEKGYVNLEQLSFLKLKDQVEIIPKDDIRIVKVTKENAEELINLIMLSNGGMDIDKSVIERKKPYFYMPNFHNYIAYVGGNVAGISSLYIKEQEGYLANDYTFEAFRGRGCQTAMLIHRIKEAKEMGVKEVYTDVEFGSISHNNMEKLGFRTVFVNSFWIKQ